MKKLYLFIFVLLTFSDIVTFKSGNKYQCNNAFVIFKDTDKLINDYIKLLLQAN